MKKSIKILTSSIIAKPKDQELNKFEITTELTTLSSTDFENVKVIFEINNVRVEKTTSIKMNKSKTEKLKFEIEDVKLWCILTINKKIQTDTETQICMK
jgi:hypothetical protein